MKSREAGEKVEGRKLMSEVTKSINRKVRKSPRSPGSGGRKGVRL